MKFSLDWTAQLFPLGMLFSHFNDPHIPCNYYIHPPTNLSHRNNCSISAVGIPASLSTAATSQYQRNQRDHIPPHILASFYQDQLLPRQRHCTWAFETWITVTSRMFAPSTTCDNFPNRVLKLTECLLFLNY